MSTPTAIRSTSARWSRSCPKQSLNSEHGPLPAPRSFAATVLARLATLTPAARDLAAAAAVSGPRCRADRALAAAGLDGTLTAVDEVLAAGVLALVPGRLPVEIRLTIRSPARPCTTISPRAVAKSCISRWRN